MFMTTKRPKTHYHHDTMVDIVNNHHQYNHHNDDDDDDDKDDTIKKQPLIPGLPDHIAQICLSKLHPTSLYNVCTSWRKLIYSPLFPPFLSLYALLTPIANKSHPQNNTAINFSSFDPVSASWRALPPPPDPPLQLLSAHPSFISRNLPIQAVSSAGRLVLVAATSNHLLPALPRPLVFDPLGPCWQYGPRVPVPRRWCAAGALGESVYVASGVGAHFSSDTARSALRWDLLKERGDQWRIQKRLKRSSHGGEWILAKPLRDSRFSREAVAAVGWRGRLCVVNVAAKEGAVYHSKLDEWGEMAAGMVTGWRGPAAAMDEEEVYVVDECKGVLRRYDEEGDYWVDVLECERFRGAQHVAAGGGRVCVVCGGGREIVVVDVAYPARMWVVEPPSGFKAVAVHVLPRMNRSEIQSHDS